MDTRTFGYVGLGVLVGIVVATLIGIPPVIWITAALVALVGSAVVQLAQSDGSSDAARMLANDNPAPTPTTAPTAPEPQRTSDVEMELVREADPSTNTPAVWLHRRGGRRVHRYETTAGWVVERVSTKDPDNPRKRIIGEPVTLATEADAITAADELAQGQTPTTPFLDRPTLAVAEV
jgi:xanthosine utilization system XapX-like protein